AAGHDLRLLPAAIAVWLATVLGVNIGWSLATAGGVVTALIGLVLLRVVHGSAAIRTSAWLLVLCGLLTATLTGSRLHADADNPLRTLAAHGASVRLRIEVDAVPKPIVSQGFAGQQGGVRTVLIDATACQLTEHGNAEPAEGSVLLLAPVRGWSNLLRGQQADAFGVLLPPESNDGTVAVLRIRGSPSKVSPASTVQRAAAALRNGLRTASGSLSGDAKGLLPGLVVGDTSGLRQSVADDFRKAGMAYLLAVGGFHFMIVCGAVLWLTRRFLGPRLAAVLTGLVLLAFFEVAGPKPSVLRAFLMVGVGLLALATGRRSSTFSALAATVLVLLLWQPEFGGNVQFALSVLATAAMVLLARPTAEALHRRGVPSGFAELIAVAVVAHLMTAPLIAAGYGQFSLTAVLANVLAEPAFVPTMVLGALAMALSPIAAPVAGFVAGLAQWPADWLIGVAHQAARVPAASLPWPTGWLGGLTLAVLIIAVVVALRSRRFRVLIVAVLAGVFVVVIPVRVAEPGWPPTGWAMVDCDVGQGDGEVLATSEPDRAIVVDTGPDEDAIDGCLSRLGVTRIPMVILSHLHADHVGGLAAVLRNRSVGAVAVGPSRVPAWAWTQVKQETAAAHVPLVELSPGQHLQWPGLGIDVIGPPAAESWPTGDDPSGTVVNNSSLVLRAQTAAGRVLLTGDIELAAQADLLDANTDVRADILKIPHHGSRYSAPGFLDAVQARVAVASVGLGNPYGHPSPLTLNRLSGDGALVLRTDHDGDVAILPGPHGPVVVRRGDPRPPPHGGSGKTGQPTNGG
ncbi:MAG TPA: DNA internalization-related competence protein ComEC/Rec2, partial [Pseudonocardiaceae bacterium]|nr:DNA internalization-related competence protein ComEC/Rec2 [Pseudonocardiaceae bacterium]